MFFLKFLRLCGVSVKIWLFMLMTPFANALDSVPIFNKCGSLKQVPQELILSSPYAQNDKSRSTIDPDAYQENKDVKKAIQKNNFRVVNAANKYLATEDLSYAKCVFEWLDQLADEKMMTILESPETQMSIGARITPLLFSALSVVHIDSSAVELGAFNEWIEIQVDQMVAYHIQNSKRGSTRNNHRYWAGLASYLAGILLDRDDYKLFGMITLKLGLNQVTDEGFLPLELARQQRAWVYHLYAAAPLTTLYFFAERDDQCLSTSDRNSLIRLVSRIVKNAYDTSDYQAATNGTEQIDGNEFPPAYRLAFLAYYKEIVDSADVTKLLKKAGKLTYSNLGGDAMLIVDNVNTGKIINGDQLGG